MDHLPVVSAAADADYLNEAFARAGRRAAVAGPIAREELHGGRCSTQVVALRCDDGQRFVLKMLSGKVTEEQAGRVRRKCRESINHIKWICDSLLR